MGSGSFELSGTIRLVVIKPRSVFCQRTSAKKRFLHEKVSRHTFSISQILLQAVIGPKKVITLGQVRVNGTWPFDRVIAAVLKSWKIVTQWNYSSSWRSSPIISFLYQFLRFTCFQTTHA